MTDPQDFHTVEAQILFLRGCIVRRTQERDRIDDAIKRLQNRLEFAVAQKIVMIKTGVC